MRSLLSISLVVLCLGGCAPDKNECKQAEEQFKAKACDEECQLKNAREYVSYCTIDPSARMDDDPAVVQKREAFQSWWDANKDK